ncbi:hypothetical protein EJB05_44780 [Eragrostis curvula]|uniref:Glycosyltransferase 61 catalytic domain-containing protein n=1 Tax=Eragrostis curvula TaxID=38414 RepID=A0A5J9TJX1_9POAL|nr:hypothetical protein EJB05_44780 [Eragrostis curvula]
MVTSSCLLYTLKTLGARDENEDSHVSEFLSCSRADAAFAGAATINAAPAKRQRSHQEQAVDVGGKGMEEEEREVPKVHTEQATAHLKEEPEEGVQEWADKNPIEEQSGSERNSDNWEETQRQPKEKDTVEFTEFGGGTDDFNNVAHAKPLCDTTFGKYDICELSGDARALGGAATSVTLVSPRAPPREWTIKPYSRKYLDGLKSVTVRSVPFAEHAPPCTTRTNAAAMVIHLGGFTGNYWHDFADVLVPLFVGARRFNGDVQLLVVNLLPFWVEKYRKIFDRITRHEIVDFDKDDGGVVRCYPHVVVGYGSRKEFTIDPAADDTGGDNLTMLDFTEFLRQAYSLPRRRPIKLSSAISRRRPRMMIFERTGSRRFMNLHEVVAAAEAAGFAVTVAGRQPRASYEELAREVNSFDAMVGVHGAGLTNCVYLPTAAVLVQVVPYGRLEGIARADFGDPARDMGLRYLEYAVAADESSLMDVFGKDHPIVRDPVAVHMSGWGNVAEWYLGKQDVRINIDRFRSVLKQAMHLLQ